MKSMKMSSQTVYLLIMTITLLIFVLLFSFFVLIPAGQEYRITRSETNKHSAELSQYQQVNDETLKKLTSLQSQHRTVIAAFENRFNQAKFTAENKKYFQNLTLTKVTKVDRQTPFDLYEVNATSKIDSPVVFYNFLDSLKTSDWIIGVNFPIHFKKEGESIISSFTMRVYNIREDEHEAKTAKKEEAGKKEEAIKSENAPAHTEKKAEHESAKE